MLLAPEIIFGQTERLNEILYRPHRMNLDGFGNSLTLYVAPTAGHSFH